MLRTVRVITLAALALPAAACQMPTGTDSEHVAVGTWGGDHIRLDVVPGGATLEYDCAHGTIDEPIVVGAGSRFSAAGTHTFEHGGPIRVDEPPNRHPARYDGRVVGDTMELTVTVADTHQRLGTFMLFFRDSSRLVKCL
jgi:hypothetical protein